MKKAIKCCLVVTLGIAVVGYSKEESSMSGAAEAKAGWEQRMNCRARLGDGDHARKLLGVMLSERTFSNLWGAHPDVCFAGKPVAYTLAQ